MRILSLLLAAAATFHHAPKPLPQGAATEDWPQFMGPTRNLVSGETKLLKTLPADGLPLVWEMETGTGYSSPVIADQKLVYMHRVEGEERVLCLKPDTGEQLWEFGYPTTFSDRYGYNNGPRASPTIVGDYVYVYGAQGKLHCLRLSDGRLVWKRDLAKEFSVPQDFFGTASTPLVEGDHLIVNVGAPEGPTVAAFDLQTGEVAWGATAGSQGALWGPSYASPVAADVHGKRRVFVFAGGESRPPTGGLIVLDPATGKVDFTFPWRSRSYESVNASTPLVFNNEVLVSATYKTGAALLRLNADGGFERAWTSDDFDLHWATPVRRDGHLYAFAGRNEPDAGLVAVNVATGETAWREVFEWKQKMKVQGGEREFYESPYRGSILDIDGRFLALGEHGHLMWLELTPKGGRVLSRTQLFLARETWNPPVVSQGLLYVTQNTRSFDGKPTRLLCYDLRGE